MFLNLVTWANVLFLVFLNHVKEIVNHNFRADFTLFFDWSSESLILHYSSLIPTLALNLFFIIVIVKLNP